MNNTASFTTIVLLILTVLNNTIFLRQRRTGRCGHSGCHPWDGDSLG